MTKTLRINFNVFAAAVVLTVAVVLSFLVLSYAHAETATLTNEATSHGITFPVPELGNCASKDECKSYCGDQTHMNACISFAKLHGLMNKDEADRAENFKKDLERGAGPGGCTNPRDCQAFCGDVQNIEVCVKFAEGHGFKDQHIEQAKKLLGYMKAGGQTPGGCTSEDSCKQYCGDFSHAEECFTFAKKIGITQLPGGVGGDNGPSLDQIQKFLDLAKSGQTPGACKTKDECESYCKDESHRDECVSFATKIGAITQDQADKIRKSTGNGPGNCNSRDACTAYCNDQAHQEECFKFAEDHGFARPGEIKQAKDGFTRLRAGLDQAPPEVTECLKSTVGQNVLDDIQSGKLTPGTEIGQSVKGCFEKFGQKGGSTEVFKNAPPEVLSCLKAKFGDDFVKIQSGATAPTPEMADTFRVCFQSVQIQNGFQGGPQNGSDSGGLGGQAAPGSVPTERIRQFIKTAPPEIAPCIKDQLGDSFDKLQAGEDVAVDTSKLKGCFEKFRSVAAPQGRMENRPQGGVQSDSQKDIKNGIENFTHENPPPMPSGIDTACLKNILGDDGIQNLKQGAPPSPDVMSAIMKCRVSGSRQDTNQFNQNRGSGLPGQGDQAPLFNQKPYFQSVPSFSAPSSGTYQQPSQGDLYQQKYQQGQYPSSGGQHPSSGQYSSPPSGTQPPPPGATGNPITDCSQKGGTWISDKVLGSYCHIYTPEERQQLQQYQQPSGTPGSLNCLPGQSWNGSSCVNSTGGTLPPPPPPTGQYPSGQYSPPPTP